jgi:hypothetical protein
VRAGAILDLVGRNSHAPAVGQRVRNLISLGFAKRTLFVRFGGIRLSSRTSDLSGNTTKHKVRPSSQIPEFKFLTAIG